MKLETDYVDAYKGDEFRKTVALLTDKFTYDFHGGELKFYFHDISYELFIAIVAIMTKYKWNK